MDTSELDKLSKLHSKEDACSLIESLYQMCLDQVPKLIADKKISSPEVKLTVYSLFKQIEEGNAPPPSERPQGQDDVKYNVWKQQMCKGEWTCKKEYVMLVSQYSNEVKQTLLKIVSGEIRDFNYKSKSNVNATTGGALAKSVPKPKNVHGEQDKRFVESLNTRELELKTVYEEIRETADAQRLIELVRSKQVKTTDRDGLGMCPLIFALDCGFGIEHLQALIDLGCDPATTDA